MKEKFKKNTKSDFEEFKKFVAKGMKGSLEKQDAIFNENELNKKLFEEAKKMANF